MKMLLLTICGIVCLITSCSAPRDIDKVSSKIYFVDSEINRLIAYERDIVNGNSDTMAKSAVDVLVSGEDENENIRRLIPDDKDCVRVRVRDNVAYVDIESDAKNGLPHSRDIEKLFIYQIVNTLTQIKGIRFVKFTVDGKAQKDFMGFYDMREVYKYTYPE